MQILIYRTKWYLFSLCLDYFLQVHSIDDTKKFWGGILPQFHQTINSVTWNWSSFSLVIFFIPLIATCSLEFAMSIALHSYYKWWEDGVGVCVCVWVFVLCSFTFWVPLFRWLEPDGFCVCFFGGVYFLCLWSL